MLGRPYKVRNEAKCTRNHKDLTHVLVTWVQGYFMFVCVCRLMEEEEERRQQTAMEVRMKKEKSEEILKERENVVQKVFMPAYGQLLVK